MSILYTTYDKSICWFVCEMLYHNMIDIINYKIKYQIATVMYKNIEPISRQITSPHQFSIRSLNLMCIVLSMKYKQPICSYNLQQFRYGLFYWSQISNSHLQKYQITLYWRQLNDKTFQNKYQPKCWMHGNLLSV